MPASAPAGRAAPLACLHPPALRGWPALQARLVDRIKRAALRQLHASAAGERLLLRTYLIGEEATELELHQQLAGERPDWLVRQMDRHLADERRHVRAFSAALAARTGAPAAAENGDGGGSAAAGKPDWLSRRKIERWRRLGQRHASGFSAGVPVPAYAIALCAEQMAARVLQRHCDVIGAAHPLFPLLSGVLADEVRHVRLCMRTLERLVRPEQHAMSAPQRPASREQVQDQARRLAQLLRDVRAIERGFGVCGALAMLLAGWALRLGAAARRRP